MQYAIVIHKEPESDYGVTVPDLPGCFTAGSTMDEALSYAVEAIECHLEGLMIDPEPIPTASSIEHHQANPDYADGIWAFVSVDLSHTTPPLHQPTNSPPHHPTTPFRE